jgi:hypothetical protein
MVGVTAEGGNSGDGDIGWLIVALMTGLSLSGDTPDGDMTGDLVFTGLISAKGGCAGTGKPYCTAPSETVARCCPRPRG